MLEPCLPTRMVTNRLQMNLAGLTAQDRRSSRKAMVMVAVCFGVAGAILAASLLFPAGSSALDLFTAMPR